MAAQKRVVLYWDPTLDRAFRRRLERALGELNIATADGDTIDHDPDAPALVMALASAAGGWALPKNPDIVVQAGPGEFPVGASALRLQVEDIEQAGPRWTRLIEKLGGKLGMPSLALTAEDLAVKLDEAARRADEAERTRDAARLAESNAIREHRRIEQELLDARKRIVALEAEQAQLRTITEGGAYGLALVPEDTRADVIAAREHAWRAQAAAARANEAAAAHPDVIAWGSTASYSGEVRNGRPDGFGVMLFGRGNDIQGWYRGGFANGARSGHGMGMSEDGLLWSGEWENDEACGLGQLEARDGQRYEGRVTLDTDGAPKAGRGWTWRAPSQSATHTAHQPVTPLIAAPKAGRLKGG